MHGLREKNMKMKTNVKLHVKKLRVVSDNYIAHINLLASRMVKNLLVEKDSLENLKRINKHKNVTVNFI